MSFSSGWVRQAAALPVKDSTICLVTATGGPYWVIPKGKIDPGKTAAETALQEAWEEAGLTGVLAPAPVGSYVYEKEGATHHVLVFPMQVTQIADDWPERNRRQRRWLDPVEALALLTAPGLCEIVRVTLLGTEGKPAQDTART